MATTVGSGFVIRGDADEALDDEEPLSDEEQLLLRIQTMLNRHCWAAALGASAELTNTIARVHGLNGGAWT